MGLSSLTFHYVEQPGPDYASDLRLYVAYMFSTAAWCSGARRVADQRNRRSAGCRGVGETGFEVGDAPVLEAQGGAGGFEAFVEGAVVGGELPDALFECGVLGGDALDRILSPLGFQVSDAAEEFSDTRALGEDFGVGFECVLGVEARSRQLASYQSSHPAASCSWRSPYFRIASVDYLRAMLVAHCPAATSCCCTSSAPTVGPVLSALSSARCGAEPTS